MATPQEIVDKVVFGGLYKVKSGTWEMAPCGWCVNDQCYLWAVPIMDDKGNLWMQDTYQLKPPFHLNGKSKTDAAIDDVCSFGPGYNGWVVKHARGNYYYKNQMEIMNDNDLDHFEFVADLHDYRGLKSGEDYLDYKNEDIISGVKLYNEHGYSWHYGAVGVKLVRKDARKNNMRILQNNIGKAYELIRYPQYAYGSRMEDIDDMFDKCCASGDMDEETRADYFRLKLLNNFLKYQKQELDIFIHTLDNSVGNM